MTIARYLLLVIAILSAISAAWQLISILMDIFGILQAYFGNATAFTFRSYMPLDVLELMVVPVIAFLASKDLKAIPPHVQEKFLFRHLGFLGWLSVAILIGSVWRAKDQLHWFFGTEHSQALVFFQIIDLASQLLYNLMVAFFLGALCLYARYRIAANKRLAIQPTPITETASS